MQALDYLKKYTSKADPFLHKYLQSKKKETQKIDPQLAKDIGIISAYVAGGKKLRGALTVLGYQAISGKPFNQRILQASCGVELEHQYLLVHDDIIDQDGIRRGKPTVHKVYARKRGSHYGTSKAIVLGDMISFIGYELIASSPFPDKHVTKALTSLNDFLLKTMYGQMLDIDFDFKRDISWDDILKVRTYKTAYYTVVMPLSVGAILAGATKSKLNSIEKYGTPIGIAFQLADDILGIFGDPKITGKSNESDIHDGKNTFLYAKALEMANNKDRKFLLKHYGAKGLDKKTIDSIREIIRKSGSLKYSQDLADRLVREGSSNIRELTSNSDYQETLGSLAKFITSRTK